MLCFCQEQPSQRSCLKDHAAAARVKNRCHLGYDVTSRNSRPPSLQREIPQDNPLFLSSPAEKGLCKKEEILI